MPYRNLRFNEVVNLENNLQSLQRNDLPSIVEVNSNHTHAAVINPDKKKAFILPYIYKLRPDKLNISRQIIHSFLLGNTISEEKNLDLKENLSPEHLNLFFNGSKEDIRSLRKSYGIDNQNDHTKWKLLHYPLSALNGSGEELLKSAEDIIIRDYEVRIAYGIVGNSHQRTDKNEIVKITTNYLANNNFSPIVNYAKDKGRNDENILLWTSEKEFSRNLFKPMIGINFGYDNGYSAYKIGVGIHITDVVDLQFTHCTSKIFAHHRNRKFLTSAFRRWEHHKQFGAAEKFISDFINKYYNPVFAAIEELLIDNKNYKFRNFKASEFINSQYYRSDFKDYKNSLNDFHHKYSKIYGATNYTHFLSWVHLAKEMVEKQNGKLEHIAQFVAECVLSRGAKR